MCRYFFGVRLDCSFVGVEKLFKVIGVIWWFLLVNVNVIVGLLRIYRLLWYIGVFGKMCLLCLLINLICNGIYNVCFVVWFVVGGVCCLRVMVILLLGLILCLIDIVGVFDWLYYREKCVKLIFVVDCMVDIKLL